MRFEAKQVEALLAKRRKFLERARAKGATRFAFAAGAAFALLMATFGFALDYCTHVRMTSAHTMRALVGNSVAGLIFGMASWYEVRKRPGSTKTIL